ncbi:hypothetical protein BaRGS_00037831, partial [Batillaria attramentaria]
LFGKNVANACEVPVELAVYLSDSRRSVVTSSRILATVSSLVAVAGLPCFLCLS